MAWNPWDSQERYLDPQTLAWLKALTDPQGDYGGSRYRTDYTGAGGGMGDGGDGTSGRGAATQFNRIKLDDNGNPIGRDWEAYDPSGKFSHGWIESTGTFMDKNGWMLPLLAAGVMNPDMFGGGANGLDLFGGGDAAALAGGSGSEALFIDPASFGLSALEPINAGALFGGIDAAKAAGALTALDPLTKAIPGLDAMKPYGFMDKVGDFLSEPANILKTVGAVGSIAEGLKDDPSTDFTQTTTRDLNPAVKTGLFGADGNGGVVGDLMNWYKANPTGQNQTMRDAQTGLRGLLTDPRVMDGYWQMGGRGIGLMNAGIAPNPWMPKIGGG